MKNNVNMSTRTTRTITASVGAGPELIMLEAVVSDEDTSLGLVTIRVLDVEGDPVAIRLPALEVERMAALVEHVRRYELHDWRFVCAVHGYSKDATCQACAESAPRLADVA